MTNRRKIIIGNWKMYKTLATAREDLQLLISLTTQQRSRLDIGIAAPAVFLSELSMCSSNAIQLYSQNAHWEMEGAFTGETSPSMLKDLRIAGSLVGHSERRQWFGETDVTVGKRMGSLLKNGLKSVVCVGETLEEREQGKVEEVLARQIRLAIENAGLHDEAEFVGANLASPLLIFAYEPVWAIGTGKSASPQEAQEAHKFIRNRLCCYLKKETAQHIKILYGGSVKPNNAGDFLGCADIDGALVGGASLKPTEFAQVIQQCP